MRLWTEYQQGNALLLRSFPEAGDGYRLTSAQIKSSRIQQHITESYQQLNPLKKYSRELSKQERKMQERKTLPWTSAALMRSRRILSGSYAVSVNQAVLRD